MPTDSWTHSEVADVYLGELPAREVDEVHADELMEKVRNC
jgi:hypothetical protein